jgi:hypothetical protein
LARVTGFGIVDGFGEGVGLMPDLFITGGEGFPDGGIGFVCIGIGIGIGIGIDDVIVDEVFVNGFELFGSSLCIVFDEL